MDTTQRTPSCLRGDGDTTASGPAAIRPVPVAGRLRDEHGSVATEYGLLAIVAATIVAVVLQWATDGGIAGLLDRVLARVATLVGM